jgi:hypothetical protein
VFLRRVDWISDYQLQSHSFPNF